MQKDRQDELKKIFDVIVFDWDGTAVPDRKASTDELQKAITPLLEADMKCVVITGTNFNHLDKQFFQYLKPEIKKNLYACTNRGSEVFSFQPDGFPQIIESVIATDIENQALDGIVLELQRQLAEQKLETSIVFNRLNRRKLDLIPIPKWQDPKKAEFQELFYDVQERLKKAGVDGGIREIIQKAAKICQDMGLVQAKVTSDIKHIEIGLTDKADSIRWLSNHIIIPGKIPHEKIIFWGDEFGSIGGITGSDALMHIPELQDCLFVSVGVEPEGVPLWVLHQKGGPEVFIQFLNQEAKRLQDRKIMEGEKCLPCKDPAWVVVQEGFDPSREREMESLFSIGNGYLGVRGSSDFLIPASQADLFVAGIYDSKVPEFPYSEVEFLTKTDVDSVTREIVPFPSPFHLKLIVDEIPLHSGYEEMKSHKRILDMKKGVMFEEFQFEDHFGKKTRISSFRCASFVNPHLLLQEIEIFCENHASLIKVNTEIDLSEIDKKYAHLNVIAHEKGHGLSEALLFAAKDSKIRCSFCVRQSFDGSDVPGHFSFHGKAGVGFHLRRMISVMSDRDVDNCLNENQSQTASLRWSDFTSYFSDHQSQWQDFWNQADVVFEDKGEFTQAQRFNHYHLRIGANNDPRTSIPAKALTGRAYEGHVFWDTEIFMFPFFLYTQPQIARHLLMYRYMTLNGARKRAKRLGGKGACFAWESTVTGEDVTPRVIHIKGTDKSIPIFTGFQQIHITADVAYAIWRYWDATLDDEFFVDYGLEILVETSRFWASRVVEKEGLYHVLDVVGPDEYHHSVNNNFYTNWMARFNLLKAATGIKWLKEKYPERYNPFLEFHSLDSSEIENWKKIASHLYMPKENTEGVIEQFDHFFELKDFHITSEEKLHAPVSRLFNWEEVNRIKLAKQADVLMVPFLFPDQFSHEKLKKNYEYYEAITDHGSSLSLCVHAALAARLGKEQESLEMWQKSLNLDLKNLMQNTELGIHVGCMGGTWQALMFHMLGVCFEDGQPVVQKNYHIVFPENCPKLHFKIQYRGKEYPLEVEKGVVLV